MTPMESNTRRKVLFAAVPAFLGAVLFFWSHSWKEILRRLNLIATQAFDAGELKNYSVTRVDGRWLESQGVWVVRSHEGFYALRARCPESGHRVNWVEGDQQFECSCSRFYKTGVCFEGPGRRALERTDVRLEGGQIMIDPSKVFRLEKSEWKLPGSFLPVS